MSTSRVRAFSAVAALVAFAIVTGLGAASVAEAAAQKAALHEVTTLPSCATASVTGAEHGFAILNETEASEGIIAEVSLKDGASDHNYTVTLIQCQGTTEVKSTPLGTLHTNIEGNGNLHGTAVEKTSTPAADHAFVTLNGGTGQLFATAKVPI